MPGAEAFPRSERLTRRFDFTQVYEEGEKWVGHGLICFVAQRPGLGRKVGFAAPRSVGGAVVRNRIKRYLREAYRRSRARLADDVYIVAVARPASANMTCRECEQRFQELLRRGNVLHG